MLEADFELEVQALMKNPAMHNELPSMRCVGYRQMWQYLSGEIDKPQMIDKGIAATRQLAKRQITWLRSMDNCRMFDPFNQTGSLEDDTLKEWLPRALLKLARASQ